MGYERLTRLLGAALLATVVACGAAEPVKSTVPVAPTHHLQVVHAMKTPERRDLVERFRRRNDEGGARGSRAQQAEWIVNEEALATSLTVVDPYVGFLRRARRRWVPKAKPSMPLSDEQARAAARGFVRHNADLLGLPRHVVVGLGERVRAVEPADHAAPNAVYAVHFDATFATKGYEAFHEIDNSADVEVFVDDDGEVSSFINLSRVHPPLRIDTRPRLHQEDGRVVAHLVGRSVFAVIDDGEGDASVPADIRDMRRLPLGKVAPDDIVRLQLVIHEATGPELAWLTYRLAYFVEVGKPVPPSMGGGDPLSAPPIFFFRYVVDADTGDVLEDARAPITPSVMPPN